jgi:hypothetical protein
MYGIADEFVRLDKPMSWRIQNLSEMPNLDWAGVKLTCVCSLMNLALRL